ncbi:MAG: hypothetical protein JXQ72_12000 [Anaerolineae bacterium]|nr:hypothetical protein [Anaerolineae bacterium]
MTDSPETIKPLHVIDTNALIWYLKRDRKLGAQASVVFAAAERGETRLIISAISIAELFYANQKHGLFEDFARTYQTIITGLAKRLEAPLLTNDPLIEAAKLVEIVW